MSDIPWTEPDLIRAFQRDSFNSRVIAVVPHTGWTGHECDLLVVTLDGLLIDVEIKISKADLKRDRAKRKWLSDRTWNSLAGCWDESSPVTHARRIWRHYFLMPAAVWDDGAAAEFLPNDAAGVLVAHGSPGASTIISRRRAVSAANAYRVSERQILDIARQCSLRLWDALTTVEALRRENYALKQDRPSPFLGD